MDDLKICAIIVLYNKKIQDSITYTNIKQIPDSQIELFVVDNSEQEQGNEIFCKERQISFLSMHGNKGLSKAYNAAIDTLKNVDVLILLDDDTEITEQYFIELKKALKLHPEIDVFAPIVYGQDGVIYSPNEFHFLKSKFITNINQKISQKRFNAIASCLAIRMRVFENYRFNEILFVDQVDQYFFYEQRKKKTQFLKIDAIVHQNFHQRAKELPSEIAWKRLHIRIIDIMRYARLMGTPYVVLGCLKGCGLGLQMGKKSKSPGISIKAILLSIKLLTHPI